MGKHAAVLGEAIRAAAGSAPASDRELLNRFNAGEQAAFAALFRRHAGMVLGVCRRALPRLQDAEDACQATFLVLARKSGSGRWQPSVANWLYLTARRVARNARLAADRRARHERKAAVPEVVQPVDRMTGRELLEALDAELDRLPPAYREPLVLCYLEGLTRDEASLRLGLSLATLKSRLERGRKRLGDALTRRGCVAGAGLLALAATSPADAATQRLADGVLAAASGRAPEAVAALASGVAVNAAAKRSIAALLVLAGTAALGLGFVSGKPATTGRPSQTTPDRPKEGAAAAPAPGTVVSGRALTPDGKPLAGAKLLLVGQDDPPVHLGVTAADGRFSVRLPKGKAGAWLVARADGFGIDFVGVETLKPGAEVVLRAVRDRPVRGRVIDTQGKPRAGVQVATVLVTAYPGDSLDSFLAMWKARPYNAPFPLGAKLLRPRQAPFFAASTDAEGRFELRGLGMERVVLLTVSGAGAATTDVWVATREGFDPAPYNEAARHKLPKESGRLPVRREPALHGPDPSLVIDSEKLVRGVVTDADTGKPRAGVRVGLETRDGRSAWLWTTTDAEGRFTFGGAPKVASYVLFLPDDPDGGFLARRVTVEDTPGQEPVVAVVKVARGVVVAGRVIDRATGKGVPGSVEAVPLVDNALAKSRPEYDTAYFNWKKTADDGSFRLVALPGRVLLMGGAAADRVRYRPVQPDPRFPQYFGRESLGPIFYGFGGGKWMLQGNFCKVLETEPGTSAVNQDVLLGPARVERVAVRDAEGKPLAGVFATGQDDSGDGTICEGDTCPAYDLNPVRPRLMVFFSEERMLAGTLHVTAGQKRPPVATLGKMAALRGRLMGAGGTPLAGAMVRVRYRDHAADLLQHYTRLIMRGAVTEADGSFSLGSVLPGLLFELVVEHGNREIPLSPKRTALTVGPGETKDLGTLTARPVDEAPGG